MRGTAFDNVSNALADFGTWGNGIPTPGFEKYVNAAKEFLAFVHQENANAQITLSGHSLGGAVAQLLGAASGANTIAFNAPGAGKFETILRPILETAPHLAPTGTNGNINYSTIGLMVTIYRRSEIK